MNRQPCELIPWDFVVGNSHRVVVQRQVLGAILEAIMTPIDFEAELGKRIFVMRIIVGALLAGIGGFAVVAVVIRLQGNFNPALTTVFSLVGLAYTMAVAVAYFVVPGNIVQSARRRLAQSTSGNSNNEAAEAQSLLRFCAIYQTQLIV